MVNSLKDDIFDVVDCRGRIIVLAKLQGIIDPHDLSVHWLGPLELNEWNSRQRNPGRARDWLAGRMAAKCAVHLFIHHGRRMGFNPGDVEILTGESGAPLPAGLWRRGRRRIPDLSIAHTRGVAAALAGEKVGGIGPGIDVERTDRSLGERFIRTVYTPWEESRLQAMDKEARRIWRLRLWCAREAAAKGLGLGLVGRTRRFKAGEIDLASGRIIIEAALEPDQGRPDGRWEIPVQTCIHHSHILAITAPD